MKRDDREAIEELARLTGDRCLAIAFRILRDFDLADDTVQSALLTAWREIRTLRDPERFEPWLPIDSSVSADLQGESKRIPSGRPIRDVASV